MSDESKVRKTLRTPSAVLMRLFAFYLAWYFPRHFHAVRIANGERLKGQSGPLVVYLNHGSWWDPLACMLLAGRFFADRVHYAPMDANALERYQMLGKMGMFPVEQGTRRGAEQFLRASAEILNTERAMLWVTPQGAFTDARQRPVVFRKGLAGVLRRNPGATAVPLAIEYTFWDERLPEILIQVGQPKRFEAGMSTGEIENSLLSGMVSAQDALASLAMARSAGAFETVLSGKAGVGIAYDIWRRMVAMVKGRRYQAEHTVVAESTAKPAVDEGGRFFVKELKDGGANRR